MHRLILSLAVSFFLVAFVAACSQTETTDENGNGADPQDQPEPQDTDEATPQSTLAEMFACQQQGDIEGLFALKTEQAQADYFLLTMFETLMKLEDADLDDLDYEEIERIQQSFLGIFERHELDIESDWFLHAAQDSAATLRHYQELSDPVGLLSELHTWFRDDFGYDGELFPIASDYDVADISIDVTDVYAVATLNGTAIHLEQSEDRWYIATIEGEYSIAELLKSMVEDAKWAEAAGIAWTLRSTLDVHITQYGSILFEAGKDLSWDHWSVDLGLIEDDFGDMRYFTTDDILLTIEEDMYGQTHYVISINGRGFGNENPDAPEGRFLLDSDGDETIERPNAE